jgi:hypothetical protein
MADIHRAPSTITILKKRPASHGGAADECYFRKTARGKLQRGQWLLLAAWSGGGALGEYLSCCAL